MKVLKLVNLMVNDLMALKMKKHIEILKRETKTNLRQNNLKVDELPFRQQQGYIAILPTPRDEIIFSNGRDMPSITLWSWISFCFPKLK